MEDCEEGAIDAERLVSIIQCYDNEQADTKEVSQNSSSNSDLQKMSQEL